MRASPAVRSLRAAVFAALCVLLAAGGHALATGMAPPVWTQVAGFAPVFTAGWLLGGRERSLASIGGATLTAQGGLHVAFGAVRPHTMTVMHGMRMMHAAAHPHALTPHATTAHISAAVLLTWWLRRGEAALWSLLRRAATLVPGLAAWWQVLRGARAVPAAPGFVRPSADGPRALRGLLLRHAVQRRGPPTGIPYAI
ncbi:hypothetical protein [Streptomyces fulvoviolaceus]|uniref:hypothetical protein n=1 Tax=Streptomyces fulvoviolaceus TaxID=285535 RepID=UPI0004CC7DFC|nr:hypothetical protein [Streptomyces fulvoviolaceus]MCT9075940.1 hypothetical protein [Streptomyces fulvoviolaceus]